MFTLAQVIDGLKNGQSFEYAFIDRSVSGKMWVTPTRDGHFRHDVAGTSVLGGFGGSNELPIESLDDRKWPTDGWEASTLTHD